MESSEFFAQEETVSDLRHEHFELTHQVLKLLLKRKELTQKIQDQKKQLGLPIYDPHRELQLIALLTPYLNQLSLKELLAFSLVIEGQSVKEYPQWSSVLGERQDLINALTPALKSLAKLREAH